MTNEEKILEAIAQLRSDMETGFDKIGGRLDKVEDHLVKVDGRLDKVEDHLVKVDGRLDRLEADVSGIKLYQEQVLDKKLDVLVEGHQLLLETMAPKTKTEELEEKYDFLQSVVAILAKEEAKPQKAT